MLFVSDKSIVILSIPIPHPAVGGSPYSRAVTKPVSTPWASSSPSAAASAYFMNASICTLGSFNSVYALMTSCLLMKSSNLSVSPDSDLCHLASGDINAGWSIMNAGLTQSSSIYLPTSLSISLAVDLGLPQSTWLSTQSLSKNYLVSSVSRSFPRGIFTPNASSRP